MADTTLNASIAEQEVRVGDPTNSKVSISIKNTTPDAVEPVLYLLVPLSLVNKDNIENVNFGPAIFDAEREDDPPEGMTKFRLGSARGVSFSAGDILTLEMSNITAVAPTGGSSDTQTLQFQWGTRSEIEGSTNLKVDVLGEDDAPKIINFGAKNYVITNRTTKSAIELFWETSKKSIVELYRLDKMLLPEAGKLSAKMKGDYSDTGYDGAGLQPYRLKVTEDGRTIDRTIFIRVEAPGWNKINCVQGAPITILNDGDHKLYGIFNSANGSAIYPLDPSKGSLGTQTQICPDGEIPSGMEKSPAVFFKNKIFVLGGSQVDTTVFSNQVHIYDPSDSLDPPDKNRWEVASGTGIWSARMGHACAVFNDKLWVIGGVDENGNTLNDSYFSSDGKTWKKGADLKEAVCLHSAQACNGGLWVYGGVNAPFGTPRRSLWIGDGSSNWVQTEFFVSTGGLSPDPGYGAPFGSSMTAVPYSMNDSADQELKVIATFQPDDQSNIDSGMYHLQGKIQANLIKDKDTITEQDSWFTVAGSQDTQQPFQLCSTTFKDYIFVHSLLDDITTDTLTFHIK